MTQWSNVMFRDESCVSVRPKRNRLNFRRRKGMKLRQRLTVLTFKSGYQRVSVWGGFSLRGRTPLVGTIGSFDHYTYRVIIDNHVLPFVYDLHGGSNAFVLQEDDCGPHRAKSIAMYLVDEEIIRKKSPLQSSDLNTIEDI